MDDRYSVIFKDAVQLAEKINVEPSKPRVAGRQKNRGNNPSTTVEEHYRVNLAIPFIDNILENIDTKFDGMIIQGTCSKNIPTFVLQFRDVTRCHEFTGFDSEDIADTRN